MNIKIPVYISLKKIYVYILVFFMILNCHSMYEVGRTNYHFQEIIIGLMLGLSCKYIINNNFKLKNITNKVLIIIIYQLPVLIYSYLVSNYWITYIVKYIIFPILVLICISCNKNFFSDIVESFVKIMYCLSFIALLFYILATMTNTIQYTDLYYITWNNSFARSYYGVFFETSLGHAFSYKNSAIFAEAPVYASLIILSLVFELFYLNKKRVRYILLFYITLLTTFSTTSYIFIVISILGSIYIFYDKIKRKRILRMLIGIFEIIAVLAAIYIIYMLLLNKSIRGNSFLIRMDDYIAAFKSIKDNILFGNGMGKTDILVNYMSRERKMFKNLGQSSDFAGQLSSGGIYFMFIYFMGFIGINRLLGKNRSSLVVVITMIYLFIVSRIGATLFFSVFICCGIFNNNSKRKRIYLGQDK